MSKSHSDRPSVPNLPGDLRRPARPHDKPCRRSLPRYKVVLHSNPTLDLMFVVRSVMELTRFPRAEATHKMWEAHHHGRSVLLTTYLERAELYVEQFASKGLDTSVEPA
jgi:ATP-dependent Clp protease adapter protein ClpS